MALRVLMAARESYNVTTLKVEMFYWTAVLISNTLRTALGDCLSTSSGLGFPSAALVFGGLLALVALVYFFTHLSHTVLFWLAFVKHWIGAPPKMPEWR